MVDEQRDIGAVHNNDINYIKSEKRIQLFSLLGTTLCGLFAFFIFATVFILLLSRGKNVIKMKHLPLSDNVKLILVAFRHGHRNPTQFLKNDTTHDIWAWQGASQLTTLGKQQAYSLGEFLRDRYGHLVNHAFFPNELKAYTSSAERSQQTLQTVLAAFYEPRERSLWNPNLLWQPVPYEISDPMLRIYNVPCPYYKEVYQQISDDNTPAALNWLKLEKNLSEYVAKHSGLNASLSDLADVADNLYSMKVLNVPLPTWVMNPKLPGYPPRDMYRDILQFSEAHQIMCADDPDCSRIMSGLWLNQILDLLHQKNKKQLTNRAYFYSAHMETVLSLIRLLQVDDISEISNSGGFILEYTDIPIASVRVISHGVDPENSDIRLAEIKRLSYCRYYEWCPLDIFLRNVQLSAFSDWKRACNLSEC